MSSCKFLSHQQETTDETPIPHPDLFRGRQGRCRPSAFAIDAVVKDEGKTHLGQKAIAAWWRAAKAQYQHTADPREISEAGGYITVLAEVSGKFSGSPAMLSFRFTLKDQEIATLEIGV